MISGFRSMIILCLLTFALCANAGTILSVTGSNDQNLGLNSQQALGISFTLSSLWTGVSVSATLVGGTGPTGDAWLTSAVGPGTTPASQIAFTPFSLPSPQASVDLFSGLTLSPGTYYLTLLNSGPTGAWVATPSPVVSAGPGVIQDTSYYASQPSALYPPANAFNFISGPVYELFSIDGTLAPEPSSFVLVMGAFLCWQTLREVKRRMLARWLSIGK